MQYIAIDGIDSALTLCGLVFGAFGVAFGGALQWVV
jgi:hypothetical protein